MGLFRGSVTGVVPAGQAYIGSFWLILAWALPRTRLDSALAPAARGLARRRSAFPVVGVDATREAVELPLIVEDAWHLALGSSAALGEDTQVR